MVAGEKHLKKSKRAKRAWLKSTLTITAVLLLLASLLLNLFHFVTPVVKYYGTGMSPTLEDGRILVVNKMAKVQAGDVVAFYYNNKVLVRRVVAVGGEQVTLDIFGNVKINGNPLEEPYLQNKTLGQCNLDFPYTVPANHYFVLGDNRQTAMDSRLKEIGAVDQERLIGKVWFSLN